MANDQNTKSLEQQHDPFTFVVGIFFACIVTALAHGYFALAAAQDMGPSTRFFRVLTLYVLPGFAAGFVWARWWGLLVGAGIGAAVRLLSLINLAFVVPYANGANEFSFDAAVGASSPFLLYLLASIFAALVAGAAGWALGSGGGAQHRWYGWLRKVGVGILFLGFILAGGAWLYGFLPLKKTQGFEDKMEYVSGIVAKLDAPVTLILWVGVGLTVCSLLIALGSLAMRRGAQAAEESA